MATLTNEEIIEAIGGKTVLDLCDLIKGIEDKFGVKAAAPVAVAAAPAAGALPPKRLKSKRSSRSFLRKAERRKSR